jgi:AAA domain (dynein-related subfamily)/EVE domain
MNTSKIQFEKLRSIFDLHLKPLWEGEKTDKDWIMRYGGGETYIQEKVLKVASPYITKESIEIDIKNNLINCLQKHKNLLSVYEGMQAKDFINHKPEAELKIHFTDLIYGSQVMERRLNDFYKWSKPTLIEPDGNKKVGINPTVISYFLSIADPRNKAYCKPRAYKKAVEEFIGKGSVIKNPLKRIIHCNGFYKEILSILESDYGLESGNLFDVHSIFYYLKSEPWEYENSDSSSWIFQANPKYYDIESALKSLKEIKWSIRQHSDKIRPKDNVYIWQSGQNAGILAVGKVLSEPQMVKNEEEELPFEKDTDFFNKEELRSIVHIGRVLEKPITKNSLLNHPVLSELTVIRAPQMTNYQITKGQAEELDKLIHASASPSPSYTSTDCARDTGFEESLLHSWVRAIERKKQAVIYGPPGTGKTFVAEKIAKHLLSEGDGFSDLVQFHPSYSYEDFIQGIRPISKSDGTLTYPVVPGRFLEFCEKSEKRSNTCVLIIDEINRANLSRVFGELMYLLEYRDREVPLASGGTLRIPRNVRIIGTMNTADRSIALVDHALRRRFAFLALSPDYEILRRYHNGTGFDPGPLIDLLTQLNNKINDSHYEVGISFFLRNDISKQIGDIWTMEIEPYLEEYFFDQPDRVDEFRWNKIKDKI